MKHKYQLRGFALGVVVTAVFMSIIFRLDQESVESLDSQDVQLQEQEQELIDDTMVSVKEETTEVEDMIETKDATEVEDDTENLTIDELVEENLEVGESENQDSFEDTEFEQILYLQVVSGDSSVSVSNKLVDLGLVPDAYEYDLYLCANGYDKKIRTGNHEIKEGATFEEIAEIISSK